MLNFAKAVQIETEAVDVLERILSKKDDRLDRDLEVRNIKDLAVAKAVIRRLLDKIN